MCKIDYTTKKLFTTIMKPDLDVSVSLGRTADLCQIDCSFIVDIEKKGLFIMYTEINKKRSNPTCFACRIREEYIFHFFGAQSNAILF